MPTYEYVCRKCGYQFEREGKITAPPLKTCPKCRGKVTRLLSSTSFILKGSGWYVTDYARKGKDKSAQDKAAAAPEAKSAPAPEAKTDKKEKKEEKKDRKS